MEGDLTGDVAASIEGVRKVYRVGQRNDFRTLRDSLPRIGRKRRGPREDSRMWALDGVSFEVKHGEALGLIGRNGAGKTTLLKILSRITLPTEGRIRLRGNVGALLEVGTGFHPELTGRENVYLNGAILGMRKEDIRRRFDDIVEFADIGRFINTPVKFYSTGMQVRLGFAVAAYFEPDIMLVDEVLAVGDAVFQRRCLGKMDEVASEGRTVIFVSHNMSTISRLCSRAVLLDAGKVSAEGPARDVVEKYLTEGAEQGGRTWSDADMTHPAFRPLSISIRQRGVATDVVTSDDPFEISFEYELLEELKHLLFQITIRTVDGASVLTTQDRDDPAFEDLLRTRAPGRYRSSFTVPGRLFNVGRLTVDVNITTRPRTIGYFYDPNAAVFDVMHVEGVGMHINAPISSILRPLLPWTFEQLDTPREAALEPADGSVSRR